MATLAESKGEAAAQRAALLALQQQLVDALLAAQPPDAADDAAAASSPVHRRAGQERRGRVRRVGRRAVARDGARRWRAAPVYAAKAGESVRPTELLLYERHGQRWQAQWSRLLRLRAPAAPPREAGRGGAAADDQAHAALRGLGRRGEGVAAGGGRRGEGGGVGTRKQFSKKPRTQWE